MLLHQICKNCIYFEYYDDDEDIKRYCHRFPPNNYRGYEYTSSEFTKLLSDYDWCGEFKEK